MKKNMMRRNLFRSINSSIARYIAIVAIIALGAAIFVGLRTTKSDMIATGQQYMDEQNMFDLRLLNTYGWDPAHVEQVAKLPGVESAEGVISLDAILHWDQSSTESVYKVSSLPKEINRVFLHGGRLPQAPGECLLDAYQATDDVLGTTFCLATSNTEETLDAIENQTYTVVGYVSTPLYMDINRGNTTLGNGTLTGFVYLPEESFCVDYVSEIVVTLPGDKTVYSDAYHDRMVTEGERLKELVEPMAVSRFESIVEDAMAAYFESLAGSNPGFSVAGSETDSSNMSPLGGLPDGAGAEPFINLEEPTVYVLDRTANMGYVALENNSDIVQGVSAVFPAFFLLIAALVCITTMTRMVEDERTQIGTLKALGYSSISIMSKYLAYSGSAAILGCGLGVIAGSIAFPLILWDAYQIIIQLGDDFILQIDWPLCTVVVLVYTAVTLFVTWYCCHKSLKEVPAELIRPKSPASGKSIFLEKLPFWNRFSFLNKVMLRNIFRYRQRLVMMLIGVGGCTALLLTGFGIRDSIGNLADYQFDEIILYDHEVRFAEEMNEDAQKAFLESFDGRIEKAYFYHQCGMELSYNGHLADVNFIVGEEPLGDFINFHSGKTGLSVPGEGKALISVGMAKRFGISQGDVVTVRNEDMREITLEVSGIFDNNVYNYVITSPQSVISQWNIEPEKQMACVFASEGEDVYTLGADMISYEGVMNVTVNEDVRTSVGQMLEALDLVVISIVICATMLAVIVTYNLTNINIAERIREIATIKVLGFRAREAAAYVFKENLLLSIMGSILGLFGGVILLQFVISEVQVDFVWITARLVPISYLLSVAITMISAFIVDFILYFKLNKINMAEALKSVE